MSKTVNISLPEELLKEIDKAAKSEYASRSDFIRESLVNRLKGRVLVDEDFLEELLLLQDKKYLKQIKQARQEIKNGKIYSLEDALEDNK